VKDCLFEQITGSGTAGVYVNVPSGSGVTLSGVQKYNVTTPVQTGAGSVTGTPSDPLFATEKTFLAAARGDFASDLGVVPDTMGAVGPSHYVMLVNHEIAVFDKASGTKLETTGAASFFGGSVDSDMVDPRILYDPFCARWVACMLDKSTKAVRIATRESSDPSGLTSNWNRFSKSVAESDYFPDFPTMGLDVNGVYIAVRLTKGAAFNPTNWMHKVIAIKKPSGCGAITSGHIKEPIKLNDNTGYKVLWVQPALNFDTGASYAWFVGKGDPAIGSPIVYNRLQWGANDVPSFVGSATLSQSVTFPQPYPYCDLDNNLSFAVPQKPVSGGTFTPNVLAGSRLQKAVVRNGFLWTCHHVGLDGGANATYEGGTVDRTGCGWYKIKIKTDYSLSLNKTADQADYGRIYDTEASQPYHYYYPSLAVNAVGDMGMGFSGSKATEFIGAFYTGRRASGGGFPSKPVLIQAGRDYFNEVRWGDYSQTCIDPSDGKFWTIQQASEMRGAGFTEPTPWYALWVAKLTPVP